MTNGEMQKTIEFLIEQQAGLTLKIDKLVDSQAMFERQMEKTEPRLSRLEDAFVMLVQVVRNTDERVDTLGERMEALAQAQMHTDERLTVLINIVERYIAEGRNGNRQQ